MAFQVKKRPQVKRRDGKARYCWIFQGSLVSQGVQVAHQALQSFLDDMGVNLCRGDVGMAEQSLDDSQVGTVMKKVGRERVTQHMRADEARWDTGRCRKLLEIAREMLPRQMAALAG